MKITMVPGACQTSYRNTSGSYCESCFARFLMRGCDPDLACITAVEDDAAAEKTLVMQYGSHEQVVQLTDEERERLAYGDWHGWAAYIEQIPPSA